MGQGGPSVPRCRISAVQIRCPERTTSWYRHRGGAEWLIETKTSSGRPLPLMSARSVPRWGAGWDCRVVADAQAADASACCFGLTLCGAAPHAGAISAVAAAMETMSGDTRGVMCDQHDKRRLGAPPLRKGRRGSATQLGSVVRVADTVKRWLARPPIDPEREAERERIENERKTIKASQAQLGVSRGPTPSTLPPTPDTLEPDR